MSHNHRRTEKQIAKLFTGGLGGRATARLWAGLEHCPLCARVYERYEAMESSLLGAGNKPSRYAVERVAEAVFSHRSLPPAKATRVSWMKWSGAVAGALSLSLLIVLLMPFGPASHRVVLSTKETAALREINPRGTGRPGVSYVGIRVFKVTSEDAEFSEVPGVSIDDIVTFTYTYTKGNAGFLMVLGLQEAARPLWYYPNDEEKSIPIKGDRVDEPLGDGIVLSVNHRPGGLRIVSLFSETPLDRERIETDVERLRRSGRLLDENAPLLLDGGDVGTIEYSIVLRIGGSNDGE